ncbi:MAG: DUF2283 domain-containing protein [Candidatus Hydrothermarchaeales archaeon]
MEKKSKEVLVVFDPIGHTLDVWFGEPREAVSEEVEEEFLIKKDLETGEVLGFEKFNVDLGEGEAPTIKFLIKSEGGEAQV